MFVCSFDSKLIHVIHSIDLDSSFDGCARSRLNALDSNVDETRNSWSIFLKCLRIYMYEYRDCA